MLTWIKCRPINEIRGLIFLVITSGLGLFLGFFTFEPKVALSWVNLYGYCWVLGCCGLFAYALYRAILWEQVIARFRAGGWSVMLTIALLTGWTHLSEEHGFKVVNDEILLVSTSQRMHERREAATVARGYAMESEYTVMEGYLDKRPLLFPFLVSVLHDLTGYRPENAFLLNGALTAVFLGLLYLVVREVSGRAAGICAILLWMTLPLFVQIANGAGFELVNLVMLLAVTWLGLKYIQTRTSEMLSAFCLGMVLLAQARYESVLFVLPVGCIILYSWFLERRLIVSWGLILAPILLIIYPLQANVLKVNPGVLQLGDKPSAYGLYSINYFYDNVGSAMGYFLSFSRFDANSHLIALLGVFGVGFLILQLYRRARHHSGFEPREVVWFIFVLALLAQAFLMLCYFWGSYDDYITVRLSLPTQLVLVLAFIYIYPDLVPVKSRWTLLGVVSVIYIFAWTMPVVTKRGYSVVNFAAEYNNWCRSYISKAKDRRFWVIDPGSRVWSLYGVSCIGYDQIAGRVDGFMYHYNRHTFEECLVVQRLELADVESGKLVPIQNHDFQDAFELQAVAEIRYAPSYVMRLSRVVGVNELALRAWGEKRMKAKPQGNSSDIYKVNPVERMKYDLEWMRNLP